MHVLSFLYAFCLLALGVGGILAADEPGEVRALALPGLFFGGAALFCSLFALREPRHGLAGASFLGFLAFLTSAGGLLGSLPGGNLDLADSAQRQGAILCTASLLYITAAFLTWKRNRRLRAIADLAGSRSP